MSAHSSTSLGREPCLSQLSLLLLGERLSGKSSAGNTILGTREFDSGVVTTRSTKHKANVTGRQVTVVDTPGWYAWSRTPDRVAPELEQELGRGVSLSSPEPHAILLVIPATWTFGQGAWRAMEAHLRLLHTPVWQRAMVLFTHGAEMMEASVEEHIRRKGKSLQWLVERCSMRYHVLDSDSRSSEAQVQMLFEKIDRMVAVNSRPREVQRRMYAQVRESLRVERERQQQGEEMMKRMETPETMTRRRQQGMRTPRETSRSKEKLALSFVLLGRRVSGKSSVGNTILNRGEFETDKRTVRCAVGQGEVAGRTVTVVDTPGWSLFGLAKPEQVRMEIGRSASLCANGSRVTYLLAIPVDSFTEKERCAVERYLRVLGEVAWRSMVVLFTNGEQLRGMNIEKHIEKRGEPLRWILTRCGHRCHVFDNKIRGDFTQVIELLEMVELL